MRPLLSPTRSSSPPPPPSLVARGRAPASAQFDARHDDVHLRAGATSSSACRTMPGATPLRLRRRALLQQGALRLQRRRSTSTSRCSQSGFAKRDGRRTSRQHRGLDRQLDCNDINLRGARCRQLGSDADDASSSTPAAARRHSDRRADDEHVQPNRASTRRSTAASAAPAVYANPDCTHQRPAVHPDGLRARRLEQRRRARRRGDAARSTSI